MRRGLEKELAVINRQRLSEGLLPIELVSLVADTGEPGIRRHIKQIHALIQTKPAAVARNLPEGASFSLLFPRLLVRFTKAVFLPRHNEKQGEG